MNCPGDRARDTAAAASRSAASGSAELARLSELGWRSPGLVGAAEDSDVSYPTDGIAAINRHGGAGYWFDHRARWARDALTRHGVETIWDVGAGAGSMSTRLGASGFEVVAVEPLAEGARIIADHQVTTLHGTLDTLALPGNSLPAIGMFDVIEHLENPDQLLASASRVLRSGGFLMLTAPAYQALWSEEDEVAGHQIRYTRRSLDRLVERHGFEKVESGYLFAVLVPLAALLRALPYRIGRRKNADDILDTVADQLDPSPIIDRFLRILLTVERRVSRRGTVPAGLSVVGLYRRQAQTG